jgi:hypothetical protein
VSIISTAKSLAGKLIGSTSKEPDRQPEKVFVPHPIELKIKGYTLAQEARIIKRYEKSLLRASRRHPELAAKRESLRCHNYLVVRPEARATYLAYGFIRGLSYKTIEPLRYTDPLWDRVEAMVKKYGSGDSRILLQQYAAWKDAAGKPSIRGPRKPRLRQNNPEFRKQPPTIS